LRITVEKENVSKTVPLEKIFYFYDGIGKYTGKNAASLREFAEKVNEVDEKSLEFHLQRRDFENWISEALKEDELAKQISEIRESNTTGRELRERLYLIVSRRLEQLTKTTARVSNASTSVSSSSEKQFTLEELKQNNGKNGKPAYVAFKGKVYDVSDDFLWVEGDHQFEHSAGQDLTEAMQHAPHIEDVLERSPIKIIGVLVK
jgi:predicted heme/steroid binding protein